MKFTSRKRRQTPAVIIVALIDVLIVVLIFLMVTTSFKNRRSSVKVTLPETEQAETGAAPKNPLVITLKDTAPYYYVNDIPITLEKLSTDLVTLVKRNPELRVTLRADEQSKMKEFWMLSDAVRKANVKYVEILAKPPGTTAARK